MRVEDVTHSQALPSPSMTKAPDSVTLTSQGRPGLREREEGKERRGEKEERKKGGRREAGRQGGRRKRLEFMS